MSLKAAIDCGTNTFRLLIASFEDGRLVEHERLLTFVNLGEGVDANHAFTEGALQRAEECFLRYAGMIECHGCDYVRIVATSAARDVSNGERFLELARRTVGVDAEIIEGVEEAELSFRGALAGVRAESEPVLVFDTGGGSTEFVIGSADGEITSRQSVNIGSRRIRERFLHDDPPTKTQIASARDYIRSVLDADALSGVATVIGVAGTVTSLSALVQGLRVYDRERVHGSVMTAAQVTEVTNRLLAASVSEVCEWGPVPPQRAQVLCAGALIVDELMNCINAPALTISETDLLDGILLKAFEL